MADFSNYLEAAILDAVAGVGPLASVTNRYFQIHDGAPGEDGLANVIAGGRSNAFSMTGTGSSRANGVDITITGVAGGVTASHGSVWDAPTGGNCLYQGALDAPVPIPDGGDFEITVGNLTLTAD